MLILAVPARRSPRQISFCFALVRPVRVESAARMLPPKPEVQKSRNIIRYVVQEFIFPHTLAKWQRHVYSRFWGVAVSQFIRRLVFPCGQVVTVGSLFQRAEIRDNRMNFVVSKLFRKGGHFTFDAPCDDSCQPSVALGEVVQTWAFIPTHIISMTMSAVAVKELVTFFSRIGFGRVQRNRDCGFFLFYVSRFVKLQCRRDTKSRTQRC